MNPFLCAAYRKRVGSLNDMFRGRERKKTVQKLRKELFSRIEESGMRAKLGCGAKKEYK